MASTMFTWNFLESEADRRREFPVADHAIFMAHAGVSVLPRVAATAIQDYAELSCREHQESPEIWRRVADARRAAADLLGAQSDEIALLGPTALGLNLVAAGLSWQAGDEVIYYPDDYPANVYPWLNLAGRGVKPVALIPARPGEISWDLIEEKLTARTRLVALASCHYLSGYRIDVDEIGRRLHDRSILFCLDAIQSAGAFPLSVRHVDFLSADSHKWMLGPVGAGIFYVGRGVQEQLRPALLGAWNVVSPEFIARPTIQWEAGARRYEPGSLNLAGIMGMLASLRLLREADPARVAKRILELRDLLCRELQARDFRVLGPAVDAPAASGILTVSHPRTEAGVLSRRLSEQGVVHSLRQSRDGQAWLRLSPHFYNTPEEAHRVVNALKEGVR